MKLCSSCKFENPDGVDHCDICHAWLGDIADTTEALEQPQPVDNKGVEETASAIDEDPSLKLTGNCLGQVIGMRYIITGPPCSDSLGRFCAGEDAEDDSAVIIRQIPNQVCENETTLSKLKLALDLQTKLSHGKILKVLDFQTEEPFKYYIVRDVGGVSLSEKLKDGPLGMEEAINIFTQAGEAIDFAHIKNIVHGDVSAENIILGDGGKVRVRNFCAARVIKDAAIDSAGAESASFNTLRRNDIYSLGQCFYFALTGHYAVDDFTPLGTLSDKQNEALANALSDVSIKKQATAKEFLRQMGAADSKLNWNTVRLCTLNASSSRGGQIDLGDGTGVKYYYGAEITVKAICDENYHFAGWEGTAVDAGKVKDPEAGETTVLLDDEYTLIGYFEIDTHCLETSDSEGGKVIRPENRSEYVKHGTEVLIKAVADDNRHFTGWSGDAVNDGKVDDPTSCLTTVMVDSDCSVRANFAVDIFSLDIQSSDGGNTSIPDIEKTDYEYGSAVEISAIADKNHHFVRWVGKGVDEGMVEDSESAVTRLTVKGECEVKAVFEIDRHRMILSAGEGGSIIRAVDDSMGYFHGAEVRIKAEADENYHFAGWTGESVNRGKVANPQSAETKVIVNSEVSLKANFEIDTYPLAIEDVEGGTARVENSLKNEFNHGSFISIVAHPSMNYHFVKWTGTAVEAGAVEDIRSQQTLVRIEGEYSIAPVFEIDRHTLNLSADEGGFVYKPCNGPMCYDHGTEIEIRAHAENNYHFVKWSGYEVEDANSTQTKLTLNSNAAIRAEFAIDTYAITISSTEGGSAKICDSDGCVFEHRRKISIAAECLENFHFVEWTGTAVAAGMVENIKSANTTVTVKGAYTIEAIFAIDWHEVKINKCQGGCVLTPSSDIQKYAHGTKIDIKAHPDKNYHFVNWAGSSVENGKLKDADSPETSIIVDDDIMLEAVFEIDRHTVDVSAIIGGGAEIEGEQAGKFEFGSSVQAVARADDNYHFVKWIGAAVESGAIEDPDEEITAIKVNGDIRVEAVFAPDKKKLLVSSSRGGRIISPGEGEFDFDYGTDVTIEAKTDQDYHFEAWEGSAVENQSIDDSERASESITIRMDRDQSIYAAFDENEVTLASMAESHANEIAKAKAKSRKMWISAGIVFIIIIISGAANKARLGHYEDTLGDMLNGAKKYAGDKEYDKALITAGNLLELSPKFAEENDVEELIEKWETKANNGEPETDQPVDKSAIMKPK